MEHRLTSSVFNDYSATIVIFEEEAKRMTVFIIVLSISLTNLYVCNIHKLSSFFHPCIKVTETTTKIRIYAQIETKQMQINNEEEKNKKKPCRKSLQWLYW